MKIAITGATGFVGSKLVKKLSDRGDETIIFVRDPDKAKRIFPPTAFPKLTIVRADVKVAGEWQQNLSDCDAVVNLAGAPIAARWTQEHKQNILDSRKLGTRNLVAGIQAAANKPKVMVSASAIGYYGTSETAVFDENSPAGNDFLAEVCKAWEAEAMSVKAAGVRLAILRFGIVLGDGGALGKMLAPFKMFAGGPIGTGNQWFSWIHCDDLVNSIVAAIDRPEFDGIFNATAPQPVRMSEFCSTLGEALNRPSWLPVPSFVLEVMLGDGAVVVLEGQQVLPQQTVAKGFKYEYDSLKTALKQIISQL
jgi:uncharacterized protein (TIGR01777 family)